MKVSLLSAVCSTRTTSAVTFGKLSLLRPCRTSLVRLRGEEVTGREWEESPLVTGAGLERGWCYGQIC